MKHTIPNNERIDYIAQNMSAYEQDFIDDLSALLSVPSVNGPATEIAPYGVETAKALDCFIEIAKKLGFETHNYDYHAGHAEFGSGDKMIAVLCHLDVVPAGEGWKSNPFEPRIKDGHLYARGVADDKGPAMMVLYAMKALKDSGYEPPCRIRLIVGLNEESGFGCMKHYRKIGGEMPVSGFTADAEFPAVFAEKGIIRIPFHKTRNLTDSKIQIHQLKGGEAVNMVPQACRYILRKDGELLSEIEVEGMASHASRPELGENAIVKALREIANEYPDLDDDLLNLSNAYFNEHIDGKDFGIAAEDESGALTLNLGLIDVTAEKIDLTFDIRYPITQDGEEIIKVLKEKMAKFGFEAGDYRNEEPLNLGKDSLLVNTVMNVYNNAMGSNDQAVAMGGGTYARAVPNILAFGAVFPGTPDCMHQVDENASINHMLAASYIYKETLKALAENER